MERSYIKHYCLAPSTSLFTPLAAECLTPCWITLARSDLFFSVTSRPANFTCTLVAPLVSGLACQGSKKPQILSLVHREGPLAMPIFIYESTFHICGSPLAGQGTPLAGSELVALRQLQ